MMKRFVSVCIVSLAFIAPGALAHAMGWLLGYRDFDLFPLYFLSLATVMIGAIIVFLVIEMLKWRRFRNRLRTLRIQAFGSALVLQAQSFEELEWWLDHDEDLWERDVGRIRTFLRLLGSPNPYQRGHPIFRLPLFTLNWSNPTIRGVLGSLMRDLKRAGQDPKTSIRKTAT